MSEKPIPKKCDNIDAHNKHRYLKTQMNPFLGKMSIQYECPGRK